MQRKHKRTQIKEFIQRQKKKTNVENELCDYTGNNCSYWNRHKDFKEQLKTVTGKGLMD